ncbi:MAG TPA: ABC transporter ATP-binding protein [Dyella sp.]|uniref:ABC transporter ATP-binding protein n=1 Tax=Dyella sp. TaxID=1869338 RepID=UPI002CB5706C|nr:ABC transporter ATP-binding protein [Dyella sp.]HUB90364.1 ABC transporter ATP-binding protein [Dyella sp.]
MNAHDITVAVSNLTKRFGPLTAVDKLGLEVKRGEIFGLVGPDGAGKTTTLRMLAAVMAPDEGSVNVDGIDVVAQPEQVRERISYMPQRFGLYEDLTVDENIRFYADLFAVPRKLREERAARLLAASSMEHFRKRLAGQLSGGMKQKLGLACSLVHAPSIVLLDEPTTGVDPLSRREFWQILYGLRAEGVTLLISTAYLDEAERCDRLALLHGGRMLYCDTPVALRARMPGALAEFVTSTPRPLRDALQGHAGVVSVLLIGNGVHVHMDQAERLAELEGHLHNSGVPYDDARIVAPSIEDLFVALLGDAGAKP